MLELHLLMMLFETNLVSKIRTKKALCLIPNFGANKMKFNAHSGWVTNHRYSLFFQLMQ